MNTETKNGPAKTAPLQRFTDARSATPSDRM